MSIEQRVEDHIAVRAELYVPVTIPSGVPEQQHPPTLSTSNGMPLPGGKDIYLTKTQAMSLYENLRSTIFNVAPGESLGDTAAFRDGLYEIAKILAPGNVSFIGKARVEEIIVSLIPPPEKKPGE